MVLIGKQRLIVLAIAVSNVVALWYLYEMHHAQTWEAHHVPHLTKEMLGKVAKNGMVFATFGNTAYVNMITNFVRSLHAINITNVIVATLDDEATVRLKQSYPGMHVVSLTNNMGYDLPYQSTGFTKMGREKAALAYLIVKHGFSVFLCDVDSVIVRDPTPYFARYPDLDVLVATDYPATTAQGRSEVGLEDSKVVFDYYFNIGLLFLRPSTLPLLRYWGAALDRHPTWWDQSAFTSLLKKGWDESRGSRKGAALAFNGKLQAGILPTHLFASGYTCSMARLHEKYNVTPYAVHLSMAKGKHSKVNRLKEEMLWIDSPDYYSNPSTKYLTLDLALDPALLSAIKREGDVGIPKHFALVNSQFKQFRQALALAVAMNRTLIMPWFTCGYDSPLNSHDGVYKNSELTIPFKCPMDNLHNMDEWVGWNEPEFPLSFREHSFLANPRTPMMRTYKLKPTDIPPGGFDDHAAVAFSNTHPQQVLHLGTLPSHVVWKGFSDPKKQHRFVKATGKLAGTYCCPKKTRKHIRYNYWANEEPSPPIFH